MTDKELVLKMYETALSFYETSNIPEYFVGALDTVEASLAKHKVTPKNLKDVTDVDWKKLVYQIMYDLKYAWFISSEYGEEDAIGQSQLCEELCMITNENNYDFHNNKTIQKIYNKAKEEYGLL